ncbi:tripartite tricarboxylate transporter TctB family protein [Hydrogenophaga sp.]|uniref:tripartite tricarboxylate transporter TctB family protein n=1 Tax=Hydrogenophaga sp. TaxID=1904254 RepID=UPI0027195B41|nr:tripartite tricarboxylate transporter TctB family protein [Hydrogenophaga sp.]MDO9434839.1 tripartite tricarboxylate transporter TctB family protein [Hydrogenophaga sp.]
MSDRVLGAVSVVTAAAMAWATRDYVAPYSYEPLGPRAFPLLLAICMGLGGLWLLFRPTAGGEAFRQVPWKGTLCCCGAILVYAALFQSLGFILATVLMSFPVGMAFGGTWKQSLLAGIGIGVGFHFLFDKLLDVTMPGGVLSFML